MNVEHYLKENQPVIYRSFCNALQLNRLSHAYLLVGNQGTPLLDVATFLAKSLLCDNPQPLACNNCLTCMRIDEHNYADFMIVDGKSTTIKKSDVQLIEENFEKTALETKGRMVYIINVVENMTAEAVNSLLKFLEEPGKEIFAFLTTENEMRVLPTIISRTQKLVLKPIKQDANINEAIDLGVEESDAEILSFFYSDSNLIKEVATNDDFIKGKDAVIKTLESLCVSKKELIFTIEKDIIPILNAKESVRFFLDTLTIFLKEVLNIQSNCPIILNSYGKMITSLATTFKNTENILVEIMLTRGKIDLNITLSLILDHLAYILAKGAK